jgi:hypothetical protein
MMILIQVREHQVLPLTVEPSDTLLSLKTKIMELDGVPIDQQILIFKGKSMDDDDRLLTDYNVTEGGKIYLVLRLRGCSNCEHCKNNNPIVK